MRATRYRAAMLALAVSVPLLLVPAAAAAHPRAHPAPTAAGPLTDLSSASDDPTDGARAAVRVLRIAGHTLVLLRVRGYDPAAAGATFGAHVHTGPCVEDDGAAAGPHFNIDVHRGVDPATVSPWTEVWLDHEVRRNGTAVALALVPFRLPRSEARSIVVHALPTDPSGAAGARLACLGLPS